MKKLFFILFILIISCAKDGEQYDKQTNQINADQVTETRAGREYAVFDIDNMAILDNKYNTQYLFNKDSIVLIRQQRLDGEIISYGNNGVKMGVFNVQVNFKDGTTFHFNGYATDEKLPSKRKNIYIKTPVGINYGKNIKNYIIIWRQNDFITYYDFKFGYFKKKFLHTVYDNKSIILYKDYIPSELEKSNIFLLNYSF